MSTAIANNSSENTMQTSKPSVTITYNVAFLGKDVGHLRAVMHRAGDDLRWQADVVSKGFLANFVAGDRNYAGHIAWDSKTKAFSPRSLAKKMPSNPSNNISYQFGQEKIKISFIKNDLPTSTILKAPADVKDYLSMHLQLLADMKRGNTNMSYTYIDDKELNTYSYAVSEKEYIDDPLSGREGEIETIRVDRIKNNQVAASYWVSPKDGYLPVLIKILRKGSVYFVLSATDVLVHQALFEDKPVASKK